MHLSHCLLLSALLTPLTSQQVLQRDKMGPLAAHQDWGVLMRDTGMGPCWISLLFPKG